MSLPTVLEKICGRKFEEIAERKAGLTLQDLQQAVADVAQTRGFVNAISEKLSQGKPAVISEIKKASPSKGVIREDFDPASFAKSYDEAGAACLSVLTDKDYFQGCEEFLKQARAACSVPVLRKDFTVDPYQVYEARHIGADAILLIVAALTKETLFELNDLAHSIGLDVLIEVHNEEELETALRTDNKLIGINNRNLHNFETSLNTTLDMISMVPEGRILITESGIENREQILMMREKGVNSFLVGETFMRFQDPGEGLTKLFF